MNSSDDLKVWNDEGWFSCITRFTSWKNHSKCNLKAQLFRVDFECNDTFENWALDKQYCLYLAELIGLITDKSKTKVGAM
jgi:hypothetical protein